MKYRISGWVCEKCGEVFVFGGSCLRHERTCDGVPPLPSRPPECPELCAKALEDIRQAYNRGYHDGQGGISE